MFSVLKSATMDPNRSSKMNPHPPVTSSTLSGASVQTAQGNKFTNIGGDQTRVTQNFNIKINTFFILSTLLDMIFNRRSQPTSADNDSTNSGNAQPQVAAVATDAGSSVSSSIATVTDITSQDANPSSSAVLEGQRCTISPLSTMLSFPEIYTVSMLECASGYPLYDPRPSGGSSTEYGRKGIRVGDVGIVTENGKFDFLFNICPPLNSSINPLELPEGFEILEYPEMEVTPEHFPGDTHLFSSGVSREGEPGVSYKCSAPDGAILELPAGATIIEASNKLSFKALAARHAEKWYEYTVVTRGRDVPNGALYLITSCIKCTYWGIAVFNRASSAQDHLQFILNDPLTGDNQLSLTPYRWKGSGAVIRKVSPNLDTANDSSTNQCVFLRGYKITLREDIWNSLMDDEYIVATIGTSSSHSPNPKGSSQARGASSASGDGSQRKTGSTGGSAYKLMSATEHGKKPIFKGEPATKAKPSGHQQIPHKTTSGSERVILEAASDIPSLTHPSNLINAILLQQEPNATVAITHDDDWCGLLRGVCPSGIVDINQSCSVDDLADVARSYRSTVDEHGCASLERIPLDVSRRMGASAGAARPVHYARDTEKLTVHDDSPPEYHLHERPFSTSSIKPFPTSSIKAFPTIEKSSKTLDRDYTSSKTQKDFYAIILRKAVPEGCARDRVDLYQTVIGSIILNQRPLSIYALARLADIEADDIVALLGNLSHAIFLDSDNIPLFRNKSFLNYIQDPIRCKDKDLLINPRSHHTRMAIRCLRLSNRHLKQNILDLGDPARFMDNDDALKNQGLHEDDIQKYVPSELQYACLYFADHIEGADVEDVELAEELKRFLNERLLNWLEALSWIRNLAFAHRTLLTLQKQPLRISSDAHQLVASALRFVGKFYHLIQRSALHIYHSALPFTPTESILYQRYSKHMTFREVQIGHEARNAPVTVLDHDFQNTVEHIIFSPNNTTFACFMHDNDKSVDLVTIQDAIGEIPLRKIGGEVVTIASGFLIAAAFDEGSITLYNINGVTPIAIIKPPATVVELALSPDGSRLLAGLENDTVHLWDTKTCKPIKRFDRRDRRTGISFSLDGSRAAFVSDNGVVKILDGTSGKNIIDLAFPGMTWWLTLMFSGDGSRLACLHTTSLLVLLNGRDGSLVGRAQDVGYTMAISTDGSLLVTGAGDRLKLWSGNDLTLLETLDLDFQIKSLAIGNNLIGIASNIVALYDIDSHELVARLSSAGAVTLAFSPDGTHLAVGTDDGGVQLWDVPSVTASNITEPNYPTILAFSLDCSRLASGHEDGAIQLWDTSNMAQLAAHQSHSAQVTALAFSVNDEGFASGDESGAIKLWDGKGGELRGTLMCADKVTALALSNSTLASATEDSIILWNCNTGSAIATFDQRHTECLTFSHDLSLLATTNYLEHVLTVWDTTKQKPVTTFKLIGDRDAYSIRFMPDNSQIAVQSFDDHFYLFDAHDGKTSEISVNQAISRLGLCPTWQGIPVWIGGGGIITRFPQLEGDLEVLIWPNDLLVVVGTVGSSMIAIGCADGRIILVKAI